MVLFKYAEPKKDGGVLLYPIILAEWNISLFSTKKLLQIQATALTCPAHRPANQNLALTSPGHNHIDLAYVEGC